MGEATPKRFRLTQKQRLNWLRLIRCENVGPHTFRDLINHCGTAEHAIDMLPELASRSGFRKNIKICSLEDAERELDDIEQMGARLIGMGEPEYPKALLQIPDPPPVLTMKGDFELVHRPMVGIVGSRNASVAGAKFAAQIAQELGAKGYVIASGLARGIDTSAHHAARAQGTLAALAGGLSKPYPPENIDLYNKIASGDGLVITEMPHNWTATARDFPRRNRLIAGVSLGLLVIEAAKRSGSLISARRAAEFGRLVFAVPGSPIDPRSSGTNELIKDGAILTTGASDVIDALSPLSPLVHHYPLTLEETEPKPDIAREPAAQERDRIIDALSVTPIGIDDIVRHIGCSTQLVHITLLELDLAGRLHRHPGGLVSIAMDR